MEEQEVHKRPAKGIAADATWEPTSQPIIDGQS